LRNIIPKLEGQITKKQENKQRQSVLKAMKVVKNQVFVSLLISVFITMRTIAWVDDALGRYGHDRWTLFEEEYAPLILTRRGKWLAVLFIYGWEIPWRDHPQQERATFQ
jgi:hypothetical protein